MAPIRVGIIGLSADKAAWAPRAHITPLTSDPISQHYKLTALGTSRPETAKAAAKAYGLPEDKAYSDAEAIAKDSDVDMVVVSVKVPFHKQLAMPALEAKKMVFVEWPLGNGLKEAEEMAGLARSRGLKTLVGLQARNTPVILKAKELIDSGALGRVYNTTLNFSTSMLYTLSPKSAYMNDPSTGVSWITVPVAHALDPLCFLLGEFKHLNATSTIVHPTANVLDTDGKTLETIKRATADSVSVSGILESGASVSFTANITTPALPDHLSWIIAGEKGSLKFEGVNAFISFVAPTLSLYQPGENAKWEEVEVPKSGHFGGIGEVYAAFAEGRTEALVDFEKAVTRHKMVEAIQRSSESGERVSY